jgi:predicted ArsR family transcriptional regulator
MPSERVPQPDPQRDPDLVPERERPMVQLTDPMAMRALAHPVRWELLEALTHAGTLTATQASELLGESPANCAFHLRTLAKYGLVEEAGGGRGRERPWRRAFTRMNLSIQHDDPQAAAASEVLSQFFLDRTLNRARANLSKRRAWPAAWLEKVGESQTVKYLTADEAEQMHDDVMEILGRHGERTEDPSLRPPDALPVEFLLLGYPLMDLAGLAVPEDAGDTDALEVLDGSDGADQSDGDAEPA